MRLYKYRNLDNFRFFIDIILNNRLFAPSYTNLNDPMEGHYKYKDESMTKEIFNNIHKEKQKLGICSLSECSEIELMWAHYCDGHRGVVIGVEIPDNSNNYDIRKIEYTGLPKVSQPNNDYTKYSDIAKDILTHKHEIWEYEKEVRVFVQGRDYIDATIKEVILGQKMDNRTYSFIKNLIYKINPEIVIQRANIYDL
jgi:hypothetical protein